MPIKRNYRNPCWSHNLNSESIDTPWEQSLYTNGATITNSWDKDQENFLRIHHSRWHRSCDDIGETGQHQCWKQKAQPSTAEAKATLPRSGEKYSSESSTSSKPSLQSAPRTLSVELFAAPSLLWVELTLVILSLLPMTSEAKSSPMIALTPSKTCQSRR